MSSRVENRVKEVKSVEHSFADKQYGKISDRSGEALRSQMAVCLFNTQGDEQLKQSQNIFGNKNCNHRSKLIKYFPSSSISFPMFSIML